MIEIKLADCDGNINKMLSKFKKKVRESKLIIELKERKRHTPKKEKKRNKKKKSKFKMQKKQEELFKDNF